MTSNLAVESVEHRTARINRAARAARMLWLEQILPEIWAETGLMLIRRESAEQLPEQGVMTLTTKDGWRYYRDVWRVSPHKDAWIIDDHGQLYFYLGGPDHKVIPYSMAALRDQSMAKFDREAARGLPIPDSEVRDMGLVFILHDIRAMFPGPDSDDDNLDAGQPST